MHALLGAVLLSGLGLAAPPAHPALAAPPAASPLIAENATPVAVRNAADPGLASSYFGARYYRANIGRFTTTDPVYTWRENLVDPQRWNRYAYGRNNPLRYVDPDGRDVRLASNLNKSDASFIRNALIAYVRRSEGRAQFERFAGDERTITLTAGKLNDANALRQAMRDHTPIAVRFAETSPEGEGRHGHLRCLGARA